MQDLVEYMAKGLVDNPDEVRTKQVRGRHAVIIKLRVAEEDKGWVIGKKGRVANAMRSLLYVAASLQGKKRAILDIV